MNESPPCPPGAQSAEGQAAGMHCLVGGEAAVRTRSWTGAGWRGAGSCRSQAERYLSQTGVQGSLAQEQTLELRLLDKEGDWGAEGPMQRKKQRGRRPAGKVDQEMLGAKGLSLCAVCGPGVHGAVGADVYGAQGSCAVESAFVVCSRRGQTGAEGPGQRTHGLGHCHPALSEKGDTQKGHVTHLSVLGQFLPPFTPVHFGYVLGFSPGSQDGFGSSALHIRGAPLPLSCFPHSRLDLLPLLLGLGVPGQGLAQ